MTTPFASIPLEMSLPALQRGFPSRFDHLIMPEPTLNGEAKDVGLFTEALPHGLVPPSGPSDWTRDRSVASKNYPIPRSFPAFGTTNANLQM